MEDAEIWEAYCGKGGDILEKDLREFYNVCMRDP